MLTTLAASEWTEQLKILHQQLCSIFLNFSEFFCQNSALQSPIPTSSGTSSERTRAEGRSCVHPCVLLATCSFAATPWKRKKRNFSLPTAGNGTNLWIRSRVAGVNLLALWIRTLRPTLERDKQSRAAGLKARAQLGVRV